MASSSAKASSSESCDPPGTLICGGGGRSVWKPGAIGMLEVSVRESSSEGRVEAVLGDVKGVRVGEEVFVAAVDRDPRVLVPVYPGEWKELMGTKEIGFGYGIENGVLKDSGKHPLTPTEILIAMRRETEEECMSELAAIDDYYARDACGGCSTVSGDASPASTAVIVTAMVVALVRRRRML